MKLVHVAVGVVLRGTQVFVSLRADNAHQGGKWEFPGGKVEANETVLDALRRELQEEIGILVQSSEPLLVIEHDYGDKLVKLDVHSVSAFNGEPEGKENQQTRWVEVSALEASEFPAANVAIIDALQQKYTK
ncbi:8-oxo-dGTPase [Alteromonas sp. 76-1]|uniref:8-oxo-dGTP diphosphatase MutT n=1 Tax=Alteromonas sp. 76-1 TaxID=2358187 RepID=UPI000FD1732D|nr:8-oxo-dGTP diphosphatase MutT [Alteromonas sp. 76-1]VEL98145.1 8-oxo-dGTPase [Alteromonas sp. 76-1]